MIRNGTCKTARKDFLSGVNQPGDDYRIALYTEDADLGPSTERYTTLGEVSGPGYIRGGMSLSGYKCFLNKSGAACLTWSNAEWPNTTLSSVCGALIYNASKANAAVQVIEFDTVYNSTVGPFVVKIPQDGLVVLGQ